MLSVHAALAAAQVPGYRGAFRPLKGQEEPPDTYCVYEYTRSPVWDQDDRNAGTRVRAFLHVYAVGDPEAPCAAIRAQMRAQGFRLVRETDGYVSESGMYELTAEYQGVQNVAAV